ncbi:hypothetical protein GPECTOR_12g375 [Gonium pectorale]|uniref:EF-hand domain-containing protein n=1 Tax=Gonium pectorale TaxID=33097 RepID=A0A150GNJ6_GONPE|nr:hypothetical protein GPECTOR_12g375 [Gonium pectorale]|eukprot:KXZ51413.1 hypothetical protein GPECTOR_12g375 [Gonium pectorale]
MTVQQVGLGGGSRKAIRTKDILKAAVTNRRQAIDTFLKELDTNKDGDIGVDELLSLMENVAVQRRQRKWMWFAIVALTFCALSTIAATVGLTYAVLKAVQDTEVMPGS